MPLFDQTASTYDEWCKTPLGHFVDLVEKQVMMEVAKPIQGEKVLDLGCGTGIYSLLLAELGGEVTGIDISPAMLEVAKRKASEANQSIDLVEGDILHLPFPDQSFDLVVSNIVLEFVDSPRKVISEAIRVLKPHGRLVIGFIGQKSDWARRYLKQGKEKEKSVFSGAHFYQLAEIEQMSERSPSEWRFGLYISPSEFEDRDQAMTLEKERARKQEEEGAGFIVVKWGV